MDHLLRFRNVVSRVSYPNREFHVTYSSGRHYLQLQYTAPDAQRPGDLIRNYGRKWNLSIHMTDSEIVQTCFKAIMTSIEHEAREYFKYRGRSIFGPHFDVEKLHELCGLGLEALDVRADDPAP